jgi:hypothetical protein
MGDACNLPIKTAVGELECNVRVAGADDGPAPSGYLNELTGAHELRSEGNHAYRREVQKSAQADRVGRYDVLCGMGSLPFQIYERSLEVYS